MGLLSGRTSVTVASNSRWEPRNKEHQRTPSSSEKKLVLLDETGLQQMATKLFQFLSQPPKTPHKNQEKILLLCPDAAAAHPQLPLVSPEPRAHLQGCLAFIHQPLHQVVLGLGQQLLDLPAALRERHGPVPQVVQDCPKVLPTAVDQDPAWGHSKDTVRI